MINQIITFSIYHRWMVVSLSAAVGLLGVWAAFETPVDAIPDLSENQVLVYSEWKGRSPREVEDQVTFPLVLELQGLRKVRVVRSSSEVGFSMINVIFDDRVDFDEARRRVSERLARARGRLPSGSSTEVTSDALATGQIFWYTVEGGGIDLGRLRAIEDWYVKPQLSAIPGVAEVSSVGGFPIEYEVAVNPSRLQVFGVLLSDVLAAVANANSTAGGHVLHKGKAEFVVRGVGLIGSSPIPGDDRFDSARAIRDLENVSVPASLGSSRSVRLGDLAHVAITPGFRRGMLEKDGNEVVGGVVLMSHGENPLEITRRIKAKILELEPGLPKGVRIIPFYDRTPLIKGAIGTVASTVVEAMISASICVLIILLHVRTSFIIVITLPLAALSSFLIMMVLRRLGIVAIEANAMSLAGIAISIGVLVDSSIVMAENVMYRLKKEFGDRPVRGDTRSIVLPACLAVGRPIVFSIAIMLISFLPVFALGGIEGKMFRPLAFTKSFALVSVAILAITLVPSLCTIFVRGRLRSELESPLVRGVVKVYKPVLLYLIDHPVAIAWILGVTLLGGFAPLGFRPLWLTMLFLALVGTAVCARSRRVMILAPATLLLAGLVIDQHIKPLSREFMTPLDEGMVMDMPISAPRASVAESGDDLKARDMVLCRFPEVDMVVGKAGRAETPTDPAPLDMIETMVNLRPREFWPRRKLALTDFRRHAETVLNALSAQRIVGPPRDARAREQLLDESVEAAQHLFDSTMREIGYSRNQELVRRLAGVSPSSIHPSDPREAAAVYQWNDHIKALDRELLDRAAPLATYLLVDQFLDRAQVIDRAIADRHALRRGTRDRLATAAQTAMSRAPSPMPASIGAHHYAASTEGLDMIEPEQVLDSLRDQLSQKLRRRLLLWKVEREELTGFGGELDLAVAMPGWTNVWTMPIQNRVDMLSTGVNTMVGIRVLGRDLDDVAIASERIAELIKRLRGAVDVVADPIRGKPYVEVRFDRVRCAQFGVSVGEANDIVETALAGKVATMTLQGRERHPVVVRNARDSRHDEQDLRDLMVPAHRDSATSQSQAVRQIPLSEVARIEVIEGPATIKGENGLLRNYVRFNLRDRDAVEFVAEAKRALANSVVLPTGVFVEWTGQFEHEARSRRTLAAVVPAAIALMLAILYFTYRDLADAALMITAVPGAIAGGLLFQWLLGIKLSVTVWIGYIACFGMATSTGIIMLVYLREAIEQAGGLETMSLADLRQAVLNGAIHRLRPKLLTEGTVVVGLAPMLWAGGPASEIIRPMAAPVLGGILFADEVIDLFLPVLFYYVRKVRWHKLHPQSLDQSDARTTNMPPATPEPVNA